MGGCKCVRAGGVPHEEPTTPPGYQRDSIGAFAISVKLLLLLYPKRGQCGEATPNCGLPFVVMAMLWWCDVFMQ